MARTFTKYPSNYVKTTAKISNSKVNDLGFDGTTPELEALCVTVGISETVNDPDGTLFDELQEKAEEILAKAQDEFDAYLASQGLEVAMGLIVNA